MGEKIYKCKYCDVMLRRPTICFHCLEKLRLIRILQAMVRNKKMELERGKNHASKN